MVGTRAKIRGRKQSKNLKRNLICCTLAAAVLALAGFLGSDRNKVTAGRPGPNEPIDFSSLAATIISLDEFGASGNNPPAVASSSSGLSTTSGMKSNFRQASVSGLVSSYSGKLQRHLESGLRNVASAEEDVGKPALLAVSWRPTDRLLADTDSASPEIARRAGQ